MPALTITTCRRPIRFNVVGTGALSKLLAGARIPARKSRAPEFGRLIPFVRTCRILLLAAVLTVGARTRVDAATLLTAKSENIAPPATKLLTGSLISPSAARTYFGASTTHTVGLTGLGSPEITALSRALKGQRNLALSSDLNAFVQNVADYVRNNIATEFRYGVSKGGRGALIDQSGTPFDQADLMVLLLQAQGVTANYRTGDVTLSAAQFGKWTGLIAGLNEGAQTFTVSASAACQMLADGGIPATVNGSSTCSGLSGNLTTVLMSHAWVQVGATDYDPSYKEYALHNGIDVPAAMGCGTASASTCGSQVSAAGMSGATQGTTSAGIPYVANYNLGSAKSAHDALKANLANYIKNGNISGQGFNASVYDVLGGKQLNPQTLTNAPLTYAVSATWNGGIPDQYRTKLNVKAGSTCGSFFADEIGGRELLYKQNIVSGYSGFFVDNQQTSNLNYVAAGACSSTAAPYVQVSVDHPYAAFNGTYADDVINFKPVDPPSDETGTSRHTEASYMYYEGGIGVTPQTYSTTYHQYATDFPEQNYLSIDSVAIVHDFGQADASAQKAMSDFISLNAGTGEKCGVTSVNENIAAHTCNVDQQATVSETFASARTLTDRLVDGVAKTVTTRHHDIGIIYAGRMIGLNMASIQESLSIAPTSGAAQDQQAAFDMSSLALAEAESRANVVASAPGISAARAFFRTNDNYQLTGTAAKIYDIAPGLMSSYVAQLPKQAKVTNADGTTSYGYYCINYYSDMGSLGGTGCWRHVALQDVANQGYSALIMEGSQGELFYSGNSQRALTMWEYAKGAATIGDGLSTAIKTTDVVDRGTLRKKFLSVAPSSGDLRYTAGQDIVTGIGDFPYSLSLVRSFTPTHREFRRDTSAWYYASGGISPVQYGFNAVEATAGPDSQYHDRLGGGWTHNFQVRLLRGNDNLYQLGSETAYFASEMIANLQVIRDLGLNGTLSQKLGSIFAINNMDRTSPGDLALGGTYNTYTLMVGAQSKVFHKAIDGSWISSGEPDARLSEATPITYTSRNGDKITFSVYRYDHVNVDWTTNSLVGAPSSYTNYGIFKADQWSFPDGIVVNFQYTPYVLSTAQNCIQGQGPPQYIGQYGYLLTRVSNNLGRALNFAYDSAGWTRQTTAGSCQDAYQDEVIYHPGYAPSPITFNTLRLKTVSADDGRQVTYALDSNLINDDGFTVTDPLNLATRYEYKAGPDSPDPTFIRRANYQMRRWFSAQDKANAYQDILYDDMFRVAKITDRNNNPTNYYPTGLYGSEQWKRAEIADGNGNVSLEQFNDTNSNILSSDPLGRTTTRSFDRSGHLLRTVMPELNAVEQTYDVRGNVTRTCRIGKSRAGQSCNQSLDLYTTTMFIEGPTVLVCVNLNTCNKPALETDPRQNTTNYNWNPTTGQLTQILRAAVWSPADNTNVRPETDANYTSTNGVSLLTSKVEKVTNTQSTTTSYEYGGGPYYALKGVVVDSGGKNLRTCLSYDANGNLIGKIDPNASLGVCP